MNKDINKKDDLQEKSLVGGSNNLNKTISSGENIIDAQIDQILEELPENKRKIIETVIMESRFSGPIPPPEILAGYKEILPDAPERILTMAEKEQSHRHSINNKSIDSFIEQTGRGQWLGFGLAVMFGVICLVLGLHGIVWLAGILGTTTVVGLTTIFVLNKRPSKTDKDTGIEEIEKNHNSKE